MFTFSIRWRTLLSLVLCGGMTSVASAAGQLELKAIDKATGQPLPARVRLKNAAGKPVKPTAKVPYWKDHFVMDGSVTLELPPGTYTFEMECGPEYRLGSGYFTLDKDSNDTKTVEMSRFIEMKKEGWWSGDLHIHRLPADIELLMRAEDLHIGPVMTWWNNQNLWKEKTLPEQPLVKFDGDRFYHVMAGEDEREGGALLYFNLPQPLGIAGSKREYPSPLKFVEQARALGGVHIDVEKPFWWDMPVWVAAGKVDSMGLANNHQQRDGMLDNEAWGRPRDTALYPSPHGNGRWSQDIYYKLLNCGLRIPPSAGSASGVLPNPVGYNRVYVHVEGELTWEKWFENLRKGQVVVTNGPMLRPRVLGPGAPQGGALPGHVFQAGKGESIELQVTLNLATRDKIDYLEVVQDGKTVHEVRLDQWAMAGGKLPPVKFDKSGWLIVRAVTNQPKTYRFASSGPYYVEIDYQRRVSKAAVQFFLDWVYERARRVKLDNADEQAEILATHKQARDWWQKKLSEANAE